MVHRGCLTLGRAAIWGWKGCYLSSSGYCLVLSSILVFFYPPDTQIPRAPIHRPPRLPKLKRSPALLDGLSAAKLPPVETEWSMFSGWPAIVPAGPPREVSFRRITSVGLSKEETQCLVLENLHFKSEDAAAPQRLPQSPEAGILPHQLQSSRVNIPENRGPSR